MASTTYYDIPKNLKLTNISENTIKVQMFGLNVWEEIPAGDSIVITSRCSEESVYFQNLTLCYGTDKDGIPTVLTCVPAE